MLDPEDRSNLELALECDDLKDVKKLIRHILNRNPEVKNPVGGNIDVTTKDKGQIIDKKV